MRIYHKQNVYEAALERIAWLFDEFPNVVVSVSGGKDSTVIFELALRVAREKGRLPLQVMFIDQEGEWASTVEQMQYMMHHKDVKPMWYLMPLRLFNATSGEDHWLMCWDPASEADWIHPLDPASEGYRVNDYGTDRFKDLFGAIINKEFAGTPTANIGGVRAEESTSRLVGLQHLAKYKWVTWGAILDAKLSHYTFYPLYDWSYTDVWKAIHENHWPYNRLYDLLYQKGIQPMNMRVSNLHHETAVTQLFNLQEFEPETYARLTNRLKGIDMAGKLGFDDYFVRQLPFMFESWREYRDYLLEHLITNPDWRKRMSKVFVYHDKNLGEKLGDSKYKAHVQAILTHDWEGVKLVNFYNSKPTRSARREHLAEVAAGVV